MTSQDIITAAPAPTSDEADQSITGRDGFIQTTALLYAIAHIQSLPLDRHRWNDMADMCRLFRHRMTHDGQFDVPVSAALTFAVQHGTGKVIDLWPDDVDTPEARVTKRVHHLHVKALAEAAMFDRVNATMAKADARMQRA